jgi:hypothetical protein
MEQVSALDRDAFGADRRFFLKRRLELYPALCKVLEHEGKIAGYILGRHGDGIDGAGPWFVRPDVQQPLQLLESLVLEFDAPLFSLGVLETNTRAVELLRRTALTEHPTPPWRMVLGPSIRLGSDPRLYAVGTAAKG